MEALFLKLVNMSISASWLVLAVVVLRFLMKKAPKWMTCALWALVAIRLVFPFSIESMFSLVPEPVSSGKIVDSITDDYWGATHIFHDNTDEYQAAVDAGREPIPAGEGHYYVVTAVDGVSEPPTFENTVVPVLSDIWIAGAILLVIYAAVSYLLIRRKVSASLHLRDNLYLCDYIESPFILGILRPRIYLPSTLSQAQWPHVIAHERAHLARRDHWWKPLGFVILCVYWFNPVLWLAYVLLCRDIELACDERVIRDMDTRQKQDYTTALLECSMPRYLIAACPLAFGEVGVKERVKTVLNYKKPAFWIILIALVLCIAAAVCFLTDPVGNSTITPGTYNNTHTDFLQTYPNIQGSQSMAGTYILQDNNLYAKDSDGIKALGRMTDYDLSMEELKGYTDPDQWNRLSFHSFASISDSQWLQMEDSTFYVWFTTSRGETYLACGIEDLGERYDAYSDDTYITQFCRLTRDDHAEEKELAWFDAIVLDARTTWMTVSPITGFWEDQYGKIEVSRYWFAEDEEMCSMSILPGEFSVGDRVRIVYDGNVAESYPAQITKTYSITKLPSQDTPPVDNDTVTPAGLQFFATVLEVTDSSMLVEPLPATAGHPGIDRIWVNRKLADSGETVQGLTVGDIVLINYSGAIAESYPGQISKVHAIRKLPPMEALPLYHSIEEAILDGCVAIVNGDAVAGQQQWETFFKRAQAGQSGSVRYVTYRTLSASIVDFESSPVAFNRYPILEVHDLTYDGTQYILRSIYSNGTTYITTCPYLLHFTQVEESVQSDYYYLTDKPDLTLETIQEYVAVSFRPFDAYLTYYDHVYPNEPAQAELEAAKNALEPYMHEYKIATLDANELTHRLDMTISEWVDGLDELISQFLDTRYVTIIPQNGTLVLTDRNDLHTRFPEYFALPVYKGLDLYAFEDGYILMAATNGTKTETEIRTLPLATAEEMKEILASYTDNATLDVRDILIFNRTGRDEYDIRKELGILPQWEVSLEVTHATSTEALIVYHINNLGPGEVWTGYDYHLEVLTDEGWVHYGYPPEELAWEDALLFHTTNHYPLISQNQEIFVADWSRTANAPLPPGTYRYCKGVTIYYDGEYTNQNLYAVFDVPKDSPEIPGVHMEVLNPTDTGATLAITYNGGLMGELSTQGKYYLMVDVGGGMTRYGLTPSKVAWDDVLYTLKEGETVYLDVRWDHTADAPLPTGMYHVVLIVDQNVPDNGAVFQFQKYITGPFAITD